MWILIIRLFVCVFLFLSDLYDSDCDVNLTIDIESSSLGLDESSSFLPSIVSSDIVISSDLTSSTVNDDEEDNDDTDLVSTTGKTIQCRDEKDFGRLDLYKS